MNLKLQLGGLRIYAGLSWSVRAYGVDSKLPDGSHILMWDFDHVAHVDILVALKDIQHRLDLPPIYVVQSNPKGGVHAYCLARTSWADAVWSVMLTDYVDPAWVKVAVLRGYFTLRYAGKYAAPPRPIGVLASDEPEDVSWTELTSVHPYWTRRGRKHGQQRD